MHLAWLLTLCSLVSWLDALSLGGNRLLVVLEEQSEKGKYSKLFDDLKSRQYELTVESPRSGKVELFQLGEKTYEHVLILPSKSKGLGPHLTTQNLIDFMADAGNVIVALSADLPVPTAVSTLLRELEIHVPPHRPEKVVDHHEHDEQSAAESHDVLLLPGTGLVRAGDSPLLEVAGTIAVPRAVGHRLGNDSPLLSRVLAASPNAYSYSAEDEDEGIEKVFGSGCQLGIVSVVQARNSARLAVVGSAEMLQNDWFDGTVKRAGKVQKTANREFARKLFAWTYQELGVLRVGKLEHYLTDPASAAPARGSNGTSLAERAVNPKIYRIKNEVTFTIEISEYRMDRFVPFTPPQGDELQLEFTMLSPYFRINLRVLSETANSTVFGTSFTLPDQYGIFAFNVNYKRPLLSNVEEKRQVTVRHTAHDEWPRSFDISGALVWIAGLWVTVAGWLAFVLVWMYSKPTDRTAALMGKKDL